MPPTDASSNGMTPYRNLIHRSYSTVNMVVTAVERVLNARKMAGHRTLPPERPMAKELQCSVMTLRKALKILEERGQIRNVNGIKEIRDTARSLGNKGSYTVYFVANGDGLPNVRQYLRIYLGLERRFRNSPICIKPFCIQPNASYSHVMANWELPYATIFAESFDEVRAQLLAKFGECDRVIGINGEEIGHVPNIVALNDFAAGHLAAEKLLEAGCVNPAIIYSRWRCRPFDERRNGFVAALQENGIDAANAVYGEKWEGQGYSTTENLALVAQVLKDGHDGLFLFTDELSQIVCDYLHEQRRMPDDFKFQTS